MKFGDQRCLALVLALAIGALLAWSASRTPAPRSAGAPQAVFAAGRAMTTVRAVAARAHPTGSAEAGLVRGYLMQQMQGLGLQPRTATGEAIEIPHWAPSGWAFGGRAENLIGVLKGTDPSLPAVALMAHSDSVPGSPGAADDAAGVASALEVVRALKAMGQHRRDVAVLLTDGEEPGLLGARAYFASDDPLLPHLGEVVNLEARGGGGRTAMFQTGDRNGAHIGLFAGAVGDTDANALTSEVYRYMPNDTDFTVSKNRGLPGFNFAFLGEEFDYHSPSSTPAALDQGALQHMGDQALSVVRAMADAPALPGPSADAAYSDLLGHAVIAYPAVLGGWIILVLSLALAGAAAAWGQKRDGMRLLRPGAMAWGAAGTLLIPAGAAVLLWAAAHLIGLGDFTRHRALLAAYPALFTGFVLLVLGAGLFLAGPVQPGRSWSLLVGLKATRWSGWAGAVLVLALVSVGLLVVAPPMAFLTEWPLLAAAVSMAAIAALGGRFEAPLAVAVSAAIALAVLAHLGHFADQTFTAVGEDLPELLALYVLLAIPVLFPLLEGWAHGGWRVRLAALLLILTGVGALAHAALHAPWSPRTPRAVQALFIEDRATGKSWKASALDVLDPWSASALGAPQTRPVRQPVAALDGDFWLTPAAAADEQRPVFTSSRDGDQVVVHIAPQAGGRELRLTLTANVAVHDLTLDGRPAPLLARPGAVSHARWSAPGDGLTLRFTPAGPGELDLKYAEIKDGWPVGVAPPPKPGDAMAWGLSDTTVVVDELKTRW